MADKLFNLDEKGRKILSELDKNSRQSDSQIAKKVRMSKQVVNYRINKMLQENLIHNFYTLINVGKLGLNTHYLFLQFENITKQQEQELLDKLKTLSYVGWLVSCTGRWDAILLVYANSVSQLDQMINQITLLCDKHLHEYNFTSLITAEHISYKFISKKQDYYSIKQTEKQEVSVLAPEDKKILQVIDQKARLPLQEVAQQTKLPLHVVNYHFKKLVKNKVIESFKPKINVSKLGFQWYLLLIQFQNVSPQRRMEFMNFCKQYPKFYYVTHTLGNYNLMLDLYVGNTDEFKEVLWDLKEKFPDVIRMLESAVIFEEKKISYFPEDLT